MCFAGRITDCTCNALWQSRTEHKYLFAKTRIQRELYNEKERMMMREE